jgi:hypothetical protein
MQKHAPDLWELLSVLLSADPRQSYKREWTRKKGEQGEISGVSQQEHKRREFAEVELGDLDDNGWENVHDDEDEPEDLQE